MTNVSIEAENHIISCILQFGASDSATARALEILTPADFRQGINNAVFSAAQKLFKDGQPVELITVGSKLDDDYMPTLTELACVAITSANMGHYIRILQEQRQRERVIAAVKKALDGDMLIDSLVKIAENEKNRLPECDYRGRSGTAILQAAAEIARPIDKKSRIKTGFLKLDKTLYGLERGTVSIVGAYPSGGKTTFGINVLTKQFREGTNAVMFSLEMTTAQIYERMTADYCDIDYGSIRQHELTAAEKERAGALSVKLAREKKITVIDDIYTAEEICRAISELKPDMAVIDFIQCVRTVKKCEGRRAEIDYISQLFKASAKQNKCHIMVLSQVRRTTDGVKRPPRMSDLKESGALEQDGDYIIMLHRPYVQDKAADSTEAHILLDKNKYGDTGQIEYKFFGAKQRFVERL